MKEIFEEKFPRYRWGIWSKRSFTNISNLDTNTISKNKFLTSYVLSTNVQIVKIIWDMISRPWIWIPTGWTTCILVVFWMVSSRVHRERWWRENPWLYQICRGVWVGLLLLKIELEQEPNFVQNDASIYLQSGQASHKVGISLFLCRSYVYLDHLYLLCYNILFLRGLV